MEELILTRYLFSYSEVKQTLFVEILDGNVGAALYWGYELYWSGYDDETFEWLLNTYDLMFEANEEFKNRINGEYEEWKENNELYENLGTIIINMCYRSFSISKFTNTYFNTQCIDDDNLKRNSDLYINIMKEDVSEYKTKIAGTVKNFNTELESQLYYELTCINTAIADVGKIKK